MSRKIKFRVWDKSIKKMHVCGEDGHDSVLFDQDGTMQYYNLQNGEGSGEHGDYELMQYTGLQDWNGKEIYEGDIARHRRIGNHELEIGIVSIHPTQGVKIGNWPSGFDYEVIGNAFDHPHLLKGDDTDAT